MRDRYLEEAKELLYKEETRTCAVVWADEAAKEPYVSEEKGIRPLMKLLEEGGLALSNGCLADKVIGKAAAFLAVYGGVSQIYADVISEAALRVLQAEEVYCEYREVVPYIVNRTKTGRCPMESAVWEISDADMAYRVLKEKING
ncbi:DUF1893 domain-containing protein [Bariatricus massiliensis]|uniref:DUF1893 domain-containing protein n=1 Tax=Bariatricus massiliensis TaxID=1745713 RepID=A0ABS8DEJ9_9FIRM|nr:DUF1893 domain-containing protein [Bariatricus massiliensis]MCB7303427.1 DUF1893 domain-containing protein [Bariatricus massiliensis]MCB7373559.1 DUF1893 domain-containing protein [Bariatricus massiliensis]MCB7386229.1 DUF1893 domain-containing protein [Bariatricus massiliensis]MCB7410391.1 DUF1893 domain-containing protein [Bariatricus massiliensis]MCQ5252325.1 DUF1893 domain-containing protein [Bariatricus massiliensis]